MLAEDDDGEELQFSDDQKQQEHNANMVLSKIYDLELLDVNNQAKQAFVLLRNDGHTISIQKSDSAEKIINMIVRLPARMLATMSVHLSETDANDYFYNCVHMTNQGLNISEPTRDFTANVTSKRIESIIQDFVIKRMILHMDASEVLMHEARVHVPRGLDVIFPANCQRSAIVDYLISLSREYPEWLWDLIDTITPDDVYVDDHCLHGENRKGIAQFVELHMRGVFDGILLTQDVEIILPSEIRFCIKAGTFKNEILDKLTQHALRNPTEIWHALRLNILES